MTRAVQHRSLPVAREACSWLELEKQSHAHLSDNPGTLIFVERLMDCRLFEDAMLVLAGLLPRREAIWWGCLCLWHVYRSQADEIDMAILGAALRWVKDPTPANTLVLDKMRRNAGPGSPAAALALAAFWSEGSMASYT